MARTKHLLGWAAAAVVAVAVVVTVSNLPQGRPTVVVPMTPDEQVGIGRADPGFDRKAWDEAKTVEELRQVEGLHLGRNG